MSSHIPSKTPSYLDGAGRLLDRDVPPEYLQEWTERIATPVSTHEPGIRTAFIFRAGAEWLALPASVMDEVGESSPIHSLPHRGGALLGLTSVRGELLICVSLEALLGLEETDHLEKTSRMAAKRMLVAKHEGDRVAFPVSEIHGLHRYHPRELRALPATVLKVTTYMCGILPWNNRTVGCLDDELLFRALQEEIS